MKKQLLLGAFLLGSIFTANAQDSCADAAVIAAGVTNVPEITGEYPSGAVAAICSFAEGNPTDGFAAWYSFTPTGNGVISVDAGIEANAVTIDTRLRVLSGTCSALVCEATSDDISYPSDLRSRIIDLPVISGTTYYIVFDNMWYDGDVAPEFDFELTFTEVTCFPPTGFSYSEATPPTTTTVNILWEAPAASTPVSYEFEYGLVGFTQGAGIDTIETTGLEAALTGLEPGTLYEFYIRSICGEGDESEWLGPISFNTNFEPATIPYAYGFEGEGAWGSTGGWTISTNAQVGQDASYEGEGFAFSNTSNTAASDSRLFSRPISLEAGDDVYITFYTAYLGGAGISASLDLTVGTDTTDQEIIQSFSIAAVTGGITYGQNNATWTATEAGIYVFSFHQNSPAVGTGAASLLLDSVNFDSTASTDNFLASQFSIYPNPTTDIINITNTDNILVNGVNIVDINGRTVKSLKFDNVTEAQINVADLSAGVYLMNISSDNGTTTKKIVKN